MEPKERLKTVVTGMVSAVKTQTVSEAGEKPTPTTADINTVQALISQWPAMSKKAAHEIIEKYGPPNEAIASRLIWYNSGPWKRTLVYRDEIPHNFPQPHSDVLEQVIDYQVPTEKLTEISNFDGSIIVEKTKGEVSTRCDMEAANFLSLNLMHEIVLGKLTATEARKRLCDIISSYVTNRSAPFAEGFQFELPQGNTAQVDKTEIVGPLLRQVVEKGKDLAS